MDKKIIILSLLVLLCGCNNATSTPGPRPEEKEIDVYFIAGQSNAAGCSDFYREDLRTLNLSEKYSSKADTYLNGFDNVFYFGYATEVNKSMHTKFTELTPVKACMGVTKTHDFGAELGMAEYMNQHYANSDKKAVIIKYAVCASALLGQSSAFGEWSAPSYPNPSLGKDLNLYDNMIGTQTGNYEDGMLFDALVAIEEAGFNKVNYKGFYWSQGESDAGRTNYGSALKALINDFRADIDKVSNAYQQYSEYFAYESSSEMPFLISEIAPTQSGAQVKEDGTSTDNNINSIVNLQRLVASQMTNVSTLPTAEYEIKNQNAMWKSSVNDGISYCAEQWHYNGDDMLTIGNEVGNILYNYNI